jgi:endonuclease YncB( thermonuclease family)
MTKRFLFQAFLLIGIAILTACTSHSVPANHNAVAPTSLSSKTAETAKSAEPTQLAGMIVGVADGDTVTLLDANHTSFKVRLQGIDAPEKRQAFGEVSRVHLVRLISGKSVTVQWRKRDQYGRIVGKILLDGRDVCLEQIKAGLAWHYKEFEREQSEADRSLYAEAERDARSQKVGLWRDPAQTPPWDFRHHRDSTSDNQGDSTSGDHRGANSNDDKPSSASSNNAGQTSGVIRGNKNSKIYHWPGCPNYDDIAPHDRVPFQTREDAERAGYRAARNCP